MGSLGLMAQTTPTDCPVDVVNGQTVYRYRVEKSIGLWRVSQNFGVSQEEIIRWNPQLRERGLHVDEILIIPKLTQDSADVAITPAAIEKPEIPEIPKTPEIQEVPAPTPQELPGLPTIEEPSATIDTLSAENDTTTLTSIDVHPSVVLDSTALRIALLLPLRASAAKRDNNTETFWDFYEGAMLAVRDISEAGQDLEIYVYDTEKSGDKMQQIIADSVLNKMDGIIGPAYPMQLLPASEFCLQHHIPTLVPFTDQIPQLESNPYLMQFHAGEQYKAIAVADYLQAKGDSVHCILIEAKDADIASGIRELRHEIIQRGIPHSFTTIHSILVDSLSSVLRDDAQNFILFNTKKYGNLQMLMPRVLSAKNGRDLRLISQFSWQKDQILLPQIYASVFATDEPVDRTDYESRYDQYFGHEHATALLRYDLLGYDLMQQMVAYLTGKPYQGLQSDIEWQKVSEQGGLMNIRVHVVTQ